MTNEKEQQKHGVRKASETIAITVPLSELDFEEIHSQLIEHKIDLVRQEDKIAQYQGAVKEAKKAVDVLNGHIRECINSLEKNEKTVQAECWKITDFDAGLVRFIDKESGEIHKERALTDNEKQGVLNFGPADENAVDLLPPESSPDTHPDDQLDEEPNDPPTAA